MLRVVPIRGTTPCVVVMSCEDFCDRGCGIIRIGYEFCIDRVRIAGLVFSSTLDVGYFVCIVPSEVAPAIYRVLGRCGGLRANCSNDRKGDSERDDDRSKSDHVGRLKKGCLCLSEMGSFERKEI